MVFGASLTFDPAKHAVVLLVGQTDPCPFADGMA